MDKRSKILLLLVGLLTVVSIAATFYKTVILEDFNVTGVWIEFTEDGGTYAWFYYDNVEYELETEVTSEAELLSVIAAEVGEEASQLDADFVGEFDAAYEDALMINE